MNWRGNNKITKWFVAVVFFWGIIVGEILPVSLQELEQGHPGAKQALFADGRNVLPVFIIYFVLGWLFWLLYKKLHWLVVAILAAILGIIMEFSFMRPQEARGPNVVENPLGAILFFVIIWPILLATPYLIYKIYQKITLKYPALKPFILTLAVVAVVASFTHAYFFQK